MDDMLKEQAMRLEIEIFRSKRFEQRHMRCSSREKTASAKKLKQLFAMYFYSYNQLLQQDGYILPKISQDALKQDVLWYANLCCSYSIKKSEVFAKQLSSLLVNLNKLDLATKQALFTKAQSLINDLKAYYADNGELVAKTCRKDLNSRVQRYRAYSFLEQGLSYNVNWQPLQNRVEGFLKRDINNEMISHQQGVDLKEVSLNKLSECIELCFFTAFLTPAGMKNRSVVKEQVLDTLNLLHQVPIDNAQSALNDFVSASKTKQNYKYDLYFKLRLIEADEMLNKYYGESFVGRISDWSQEYNADLPTIRSLMKIQKIPA